MKVKFKKLLTNEEYEYELGEASCSFASESNQKELIFLQSREVKEEGDLEIKLVPETIYEDLSEYFKGITEQTADNEKFEVIVCGRVVFAFDSTKNLLYTTFSRNLDHNQCNQRLYIRATLKND